jgi:tRNA(Ile)-lysidine synthase
MLVGFSGGADSLALLGLLAELGKHEGFEVRAVHVDHGVRHESAADVDIVRSVARSIGVDLDLCRIPAEALARHTGVGREEAMRRERYRAFSAVAESSGAGLVALAHHQRDQAETVLLHLLRGAGIRGASGMRPVTTLTVPWWDDDAPAFGLRVWRPLLGESAADVRACATSSGLPIVEDRSNQDVSYRRNAIRHDVLPMLEDIVPGVAINLARFAGLAAVDSYELDRQAGAALDDIGDGVTLDRVWLADLPLAIRRRVLQSWIQHHAPAGLEVPLNRIEEVLRVASRPDRPRLVEIGAGVAVRVDARSLQVMDGSGDADGVSPVQPLT